MILHPLMLFVEVNSLENNYAFDTDNGIVDKVPLRSYDRLVVSASAGSSFWRRSRLKNDIKGCDIEGCYGSYHLFFQVVEYFIFRNPQSEAGNVMPPLLSYIIARWEQHVHSLVNVGHDGILLIVFLCPSAGIILFILDYFIYPCIETSV